MTRQASTPGPWTHHDKGFHPYPHVCGPMASYEHGEDNPVVAYVVGMDAEANASLIAAAPELLEVVKAFVAETADYMKINNLGDAEKQHNVRWARAAIAKAEGRSP